MYPVMALIVLMLFTWIVAMWASCGENDEPTMRRNRNRVPMNRIIGRRPNTCRYTYVFRMSDGGCHDL